MKYMEILELRIQDVELDESNPRITTEEQIELYKKIKVTTDLNDIQKYINDVLLLRWFNNQTPQDKMLLLIEEVGELAKSIRKNNSKLSIDYNRIDNFDSVENEIADVFIVLLSICNTMDISIFESFVGKEEKNIERGWEK